MIAASDTRTEPALASWAGFTVARDGAVETITLDRPDRLNAIDPAMAVDLSRYFQEKATDTACRVILMRGAGRGFCAGVDLKALGDLPPDESFGGAGVRKELAVQTMNRQFILDMRRCPQPIVALLHGPVCGAGFALALACDIRIAAADARMNCAFVNVGLGGCDIGVSYFLPRLLGASIAAELILTGRFIDAERARAVGLVASVEADGTALEAAGWAMTNDLLKVSPIALRLSKEALRFALDAGSIEAVIAMEDRNQVLCARTEDFHEALAAFTQRRSPRWSDS
jgi:enoyl-CoA hydratase